MACKADEIKRNWEYGWSEPDQNWIWPITNKRRKEQVMLMQHGFRIGDTRIERVISRIFREFDEESLPDQRMILMVKTEEGIELTGAEIDAFKHLAGNYAKWVIVNEKHIIIVAPVCHYIGKHIDELYDEPSQRGGSPSE